MTEQNATVNGFDLGMFKTAEKADEGIIVQLRQPATDEMLPVFIRVLGADSPRFKAVQRRIYDRHQERRRRRGRDKPLTADQIEAGALETLAEATLEWWMETTAEDGTVVKHSFLQLDGRRLDCNPTNAAELYRKCDEIREQVDAAIGDRVEFFR